MQEHNEILIGIQCQSQEDILEGKQPPPPPSKKTIISQLKDKNYPPVIPTEESNCGMALYIPENVSKAQIQAILTRNLYEILNAIFSQFAKCLDGYNTDLLKYFHNFSSYILSHDH